MATATIRIRPFSRPVPPARRAALAAALNELAAAHLARTLAYSWPADLPA